MKGIILNISIYLMAMVILVASVGVNVFKHICNSCHESYYTVDVTPVSQKECCTHEDCNCEQHCKSEDHKACYVDFVTENQYGDVIEHECGVDDHQHDYYHIEELYNLPSKITVESIMAFIAIPQVRINIIEVIKHRTVSHKQYLINQLTPDISVVNCCFLC